jgi:hypothetical protein
MKVLFKALGILLGLTLLLIAGGLTYVKTFLPDVGPAPDIKADRSAASVSRGRYLANHVMLCMDCHSKRDWSKFSAPMVAGTEGMGGEVFDQSIGFPGRYVAPNITPFGLKDWTDGEIFRAITSGVSRDGRPLFNIMPHHNYGKMDGKDIESVIAYLRTLPAIPNTPDQSESDFPMNFIIHTIPKKPSLAPMPLPSDSLAYGAYLAISSGCIECHTRQEKGQMVGEAYAGGFEFPLRDGSIVRSANITPDKESGIGHMSREAFIRRFKNYADPAYQSPDCSKKGSFQSVMPWTMYAGMQEQDLAAIFRYLQSLKPVSSTVTKFTPNGLAQR